jgi:hypothetical protein|tara:strand:- start:527 stop:967 length:441 start_codon:yes stop_codon:yes gene_type:complete
MKRRRLKFSDYYHEIIINEIADIYNVDKDRIFLGSRKRNIIFAKRLYIFTLRKMFGLTLKDIAEVTNLHHASIIHHSRQFEFEYNNYRTKNKNFDRVQDRVIEVEIDEEIIGLEQQLEKINKSLTKLYKINKQKHEREKRESLLTK